MVRSSKRQPSKLKISSKKKSKTKPVKSKRETLNGGSLFRKKNRQQIGGSLINLNDLVRNEDIFNIVETKKSIPIEIPKRMRRNAGFNLYTKTMKPYYFVICRFNGNLYLFCGKKDEPERELLSVQYLELPNNETDAKNEIFNKTRINLDSSKPQLNQLNVPGDKLERLNLQLREALQVGEKKQAFDVQSEKTETSTGTSTETETGTSTETETGVQESTIGGGVLRKKIRCKRKNFPKKKYTYKTPFLK